MITLILILSFFFLLIIKNYSTEELEIDLTEIQPSVDIINPNFTINNKGKKIIVKASKGNFISQDEVLLQENVFFESSDFKIFTEVVTFNRKNETASSKTKSKFESKGAIIISDGFNITNQGDNINFNGETSLILN